MTKKTPADMNEMEKVTGGMIDVPKNWARRTHPTGGWESASLENKDTQFHVPNSKEQEQPGGVSKDW